MNLPEFGVKKPFTNLMIFCAIVILALYSLSSLGVDSMPEIEVPSISVLSSYPGASPEDVESKVSEPLENELATTPGLEKITSRSVEGVSVVTLKFKWGTNLDAASNDVRDGIDKAKGDLPDIPDEMDNPFILKFNTSNTPILFIGITAEESYSGLYDLIDRKVVDHLKQVPGVGTVQLIGGLQRQINVWIDRYKLEGYGFSILDIKDVLKKENVSQPAGNIKSGLTDYLLRVPGEFASPEEMRLVILGKRNGNLIYLKDVARIEDGYKEVTEDVRINRKPGLLMMVQKQSGSNTVDVAVRAKEKLEQLKKTLPHDVGITVMMDGSTDIINSLDTLKTTVWQAAVLIILVVWFFLRRFKSSLIIAFTIPFSLLAAFIYLFTSGNTINTISLASLVIAIGMVVDNAIVVVDNISRHIERGQKPREASIFGTSEMFLSIAASSLTTIVIFVPMLFTTGVVGIIFGQLGMVVTITLLASLFTAATFTPMLCSKWLKPASAGGGKEKTLSRFYRVSENCFKSCEDLYAKSLSWCLSHKKFVILGFVSVFLASVFLAGSIGTEFIPEEDTGDVRPTVNLPIGTRVEETDKVAAQIEDIFRQEVPEEKYLYIRFGQSGGMGAVVGQSSGSHIISGGAKLVSKTERKRSVLEIAQIIRNKIRQIPGVVKTDISTSSPSNTLAMITGASSGKQIEVEIIGHSFDDTDAVAQKLKKAIENIPGAVDVTISREMNRPELRVEVNREKAADLGIDMDTVAGSVKAFVDGVDATKYREGGDTYDICVRLEEKFRVSPEDVSNLLIVSPDSGRQVKLSSIARVYESSGPLEIERKNRERVVKVQCNTYRRSMGQVTGDIKKAVNNIAVPSGINIEFGGSVEEQTKAFRDLVFLLIMGVLFVYMVMVAQFESLIDPFIIMFAVPFAFTGVIWSMFLTGMTLNIYSFIGIIMLVGVVVNNAIVLVSYINVLRARGLSMLEAVSTGGRQRLRPVLMTTITTLAGLLPMALSSGEGSEMWQPIGITMVGGLSVSALITLLFVPTLYAVFEERIKKNGSSED